MGRVFLLALLLLAAPAYSQTTSPNDEPPTKQEEPPTSEQRGTDAAPLTVKILPAENAKEIAEQAKADAKEKAIIDQRVAFETKRIADYTDRLAWFTLGLALIAGGQAYLFWVQLGFMREDKERIIALERPRLFIGKTHIQYGVVNERGDEAVSCSYSIVNYGRNPAIMVRQCVDIRCIPTLPPTPVYLHDFPTRNVIRPGEEVDGFLVRAPQSDSDDLEAMNAGTIGTYLIGYFQYRDALGGLITTGFCYRSSPLNGQLIAEGGSAYNYDRRE